MQHVEQVEDAVQTALAAALGSWVAQGVPPNPAAWLYRVAHNALIGSLRASGARQQILARLPEPPNGDAPDPRFEGEVADDLLRMLFVCCDDGIPAESRLVLALKTLCGFSTAEVARRLFTTEANVQKRLTRARDRLRAHPPDVHALAAEALAERRASVHAVLYLLFNEGYLSSQADQAVRVELVDEALRLTTVLAGHSVGQTPETCALLALMHLHAARLPTRLDGLGGLVLLEDQDRTRWDAEHLAAGAQWLARAGQGDAFTRYHAEAAIAAEHAFAPSFAQTRWREIADLYLQLDRLAPSPLHALNRAVAVAQADGPEQGLTVLAAAGLPPWLRGYHLWDAVEGELHRRAGHVDDARRCLARALASAPTAAERALLSRRLASL